MSHKLVLSVAQIRGARYLLNMTPSEFAQFSGVTRRALRGIESGQRRPNDQTNARLLAAFQEQGVDFRPGGWIRLSNDPSAWSYTDKIQLWRGGPELTVSIGQRFQCACPMYQPYVDSFVAARPWIETACCGRVQTLARLRNHSLDTGWLAFYCEGENTPSINATTDIPGPTWEFRLSHFVTVACRLDPVCRRPQYMDAQDSIDRLICRCREHLISSKLARLHAKKDRI